MTLLKIEVKTVTGKYHPEDMIKIWAPALRPNGDMVVSTAPEIVKLVQGKAEVELLPGPARIQLMCGGTLDNAVRKVTIPDAATATLRAVLEEGFDWEPEIVTEVMRYRNEAVAASTSAAEEAVAAASAATNAATSAGEAGSSASASATSAQSAAASEAAASTSAAEAATSATNAATSADESATHEDTSLDAAAAAIAAAVSVGQFQGHGFPNGVVTAPVGSIYTDLDATAGAIRWIKTSGTGNTGWQVEWGNTGWRNLPLFEAAATGAVQIRRVGDRVTVRLQNWLHQGQYNVHIVVMPQGFRTDRVAYGIAASHETVSEASIVGTYTLNRFSWARTITHSNVRPAVPQSGEVSLITTDPWPTTLPGTPA